MEALQKDKLFFNLINKITSDFVLIEYIAYYLEKYIGFRKERRLFKNNEVISINIIILKL